MTYTTYISLPNKVELDQTIDVTLRVAAINGGDTPISYGLGSKSVNDSDHEIRKETTNSVTIRDGQTFTFQVTITKEMLDKQKGNRLCGVWASQTTGKGIATNYYGITMKNAIMGEVRVFRSYSCRQGSRGYVATWYLDRYYDGIAQKINYCFGDGYARPSCRIMDEYTGEYTQMYKYIRQSLYDKRAVDPEEKEWMDARLIVVSNTWTPMDGDPRDPCEDVVCPEYDCDGVDKYSSECVEGICIRGVLIESDSSICGYIPPEPEQDVIEMICNNKRADINKDGIVDDLDMTIFRAASGTRIGDPAYNPDADINQDGIVDVTDLAILAANFGCTFPPEPEPEIPYHPPDPTTPDDECPYMECHTGDLYDSIPWHHDGKTSCMRGGLLERDSPSCDGLPNKSGMVYPYLPPEPEPEIPDPGDWNPWIKDGVITNLEITIARAFYTSGDPINGHIITDAEMSLLEYRYATGDVQPIPSPEPDPCKDVVCDDTCVGDDLYDTVCDSGVCVRGVLIESDSSICGYTPPEPEPEPEPEEPEPEEAPFPYIYIMVGLIILTFIMLVKK